MKDYKPKTLFAKHDPAHCLAPGLFRSLKKGERKLTKLDILYEFSKSLSLHFKGFEPLGADDLRVLQIIIALSGPNGLILTLNPESYVGQQLRLFINPKFEAAEKDLLVVKSSISNILREMDMAISGKNIKLVKNSLERMSTVTIITNNNNITASFRLLSFAIDNIDGKLLVCLNPRITEAILGKQQFTYINILETKNLKTDPARLIHQRLCAWIDPGKSGQVKIDTLCDYVWHNNNDNPSTIRKRQMIIRKSLTELENINWKINEYTKGRFDITRPSYNKANTQTYNTEI